MPIPFRDIAAENDAGVAGFLRFIDEEDGKGIRGAFFLITSRGEPLDFCFTRMDVHNSFLWFRGEARRHAVAAILKVLFQASNRVPNLILALADEVPAKVFIDDIHTSLPLCRLSTSDLTVQGISEDLEPMSGSLNLIWVTKRPNEESEARRLLNALNTYQLLEEPFERAATGLEEVFKS
jgi:hypothetical protein